MLVVVVPVIVLTLAFAWWYRASNKRATYSPDWSYSGHIELVVWSIPAMVVILLAAVAWIGSHELDPPRKLKSDAKPVRIEVVSLDWKWLFIYPDCRSGGGQRAGCARRSTPVEFVLTSAPCHERLLRAAARQPDLHHAGHDDAPESDGRYILATIAGLSSHFSGDGFSDMRFVVHAVSGGGIRGLAGARSARRGPDAGCATPTRSWREPSNDGPCKPTAASTPASSSTS